MRNTPRLIDSDRSWHGLGSTCRPWAAARWLALGLVCVLSLLSDGVRADSPQKSLDSAKTAELVTRLTSPSFQERLRAEADCRLTGPSILPTLTEALKSPDPELRRRAQMLIEQIEVDGLDEMIETFLAPGSTTTLPGWSIVVDLVEDSPELRAAYAEILRGNTQLVRALAHPNLMTDELQRRLENIGMNAGNGDQGISIASTSALLLLLIHPKANYPDLVATVTGNAIRSGVLSGNNATPPGQLLQALATRWVVMPQAGAAFVRLEVATRLALPEAVTPALEMLRQKNNPYQMNAAFLAIVHYGGAAEMSVVESLLGDPFEMTAKRGKSNETLNSTQLRDLALVTLIAMNNLDPTTFGLRAFSKEPSSGKVNHLNISFDSDAQREVVFEKWRTWSGKNLRKYWPLPANAEEGTRL